MVILQKRSNRKATGGRFKAMSVKRKHMAGSAATLTKLGERRVKEDRGMGGARKQRLLTHDTANVLNPKTKAFTMAKITTIVEVGANRNFARRNIMTKGTIIDTSAGKARVTSRPGQEGTINAVLIE
jgi:small subunit ribosomal protein S8e